MKRRTFAYIALVILVFTYVYTIFLVRNNTQAVIKKDMQTVSGILYAANVVLLDVEQSVEKKYAEILYSAAVEIAERGTGKFDSVDVAFYIKNNRSFALQGKRFVNKIVSCIDTLKEFPVALDCEGFYVYVYPGRYGNAVVGVFRKRVEDEKAQMGLNRFFAELSRVGLFFYVALEDMNGIVYSTVDKRLLSSLKEDSSLLEVYVEGKEKTRVIEFLGKKVLETSIPFSYGSFRGIMRVGLDASEYIGMEKRMLFEITVLYIVLFLTLVIAYVYLEKARKARVEYENIRKALEKTSVPVVIKERKKYSSLTGGKNFEEVAKKGIKDGQEVFVDGIRYLVKAISMENETYFLFISMEKEDMKRKIMEYEALGRIIGEVAHEIKNPLNGISLLVQTLNMESERREYSDILDQVKRIEESLNRFVALIAPLRLSKECVAQRDIINEALKILGVSKELIEIEGDVSLICDRDKMKEVYVNIIKNAIEASSNKKVKVKILEKSIIFRNKGNIPENILDRIFEPFYTTKVEGSGIGMYYVKKIVESHGWRIKVKNVEDEVEVEIEFAEDSRC